jgi:tight adherence protein C
VGLISFVRREDPNSRDPRPVPRIFGPFTPLLAALCPQTESGRDDMRKTLLRAGYFEPVALGNFMAVRSFLMYPPIIAGLVGGYFYPGQTGLIFLGIGFVLGILGYSLPRVILNFQASARTEEIRRGLPTLMDTLGLTLSTGAGLPQALKTSGESVRRGFPELAREVRVVTAQAPLHSVSYALNQLRDRQPIPELGSLVFLLSQGDRLGTDITKGLWELSSSLQVTSRQRAEAAANRSNFYMIFPTVLCLLLAAGLSLAGPGLVQLFESNREVDRYIEQAKEQERKLREEVENRAKQGPGQPAPKQPPQL